MYIWYYTGATDFLGLNFYTSSIVYPKDDRTDISYDADKGTAAKSDPTWIGYESSINYSVVIF